jgi:hypothetical protein
MMRTKEKNVRTVTATEEMTEFRIFRKTGKMCGSECRPSQKGKIKKIYTKPLKEEY